MVRRIIKPIKLYKAEVGVLLSKTHKEYKDYSGVYDNKHAYYDENTCFFTSKAKAIAYVKRYVRKGVLNTYGIVSVLEYNPLAIYGDDKSDMYSFEDMKSIEENGVLENYLDIYGEENWDVKNVIFNICKTDVIHIELTNIF